MPPKGNYSCLDHIFIKSQQSNLNLIEAGVIQLHITDYFSIFATLPTSSQDISDNTIIKKVLTMTSYVFFYVRKIGLIRIVHLMLMN